jgi:hypothetical protein
MGKEASGLPDRKMESIYVLQLEGNKWYVGKLAVFGSAFGI